MHSIAIDTDQNRMRRFLQWIESQGATVPSMSVIVGHGGRQVVATRPLLAGELIAHIPNNLTITPQAARESKTGKLITQHGSNIDDDDYIAAYLLQIKREGAFWKPYIDILPADYSEHPLNFSEREIEALKGSYILNPILNGISRHAYRYEQLPACLKENGWTRQAFTWARCVVHTRIHGLMHQGRRIRAMVPLSDMFNHAIDKTADWTFDVEQGFVIRAETAVGAGAPLFEKYGDRCNARLLEDYGFCLDHNPHNVAEIRLQPLLPDHPFFEQANRLGKRQWNKDVFHVTADCNDAAAKAMFSHLRLSCIGHAPDLPGQIASAADNVPPISRNNEIAALAALAGACESRLRQFPGSVEADDALLADPALERKLRNVIMVRRHEKIILKYFLELSEAALPILHDPSCDIGVCATRERRYADYFADLARLPG